jgi:hypothetical protein
LVILVFSLIVHGEWARVGSRTAAAAAAAGCMNDVYLCQTKQLAGPADSHRHVLLYQM